MLKRILFAVIPMVLAVGTVSADDNLLSKLADMNDNGTIESSLGVDESDFGKADVDALLGDDEASDDDAIAACFRRIGYGYNYRPVRYSYGYNYGYNYGYSCYRPVYRTYTYHHVYRPVYHCYTPIYTSYWGCF
jgi:hypothetical protein